MEPKEILALAALKKAAEAGKEAQKEVGTIWIRYDEDADKYDFSEDDFFKAFQADSAVLYQKDSDSTETNVYNLIIKTIDGDTSELYFSNGEDEYILHVDESEPLESEHRRSCRYSATPLAKTVWDKQNKITETTDIKLHELDAISVKTDKIEVSSELNLPTHVKREGDINIEGTGSVHISGDEDSGSVKLSPEKANIKSASITLSPATGGDKPSQYLKLDYKSKILEAENFGTVNINKKSTGASHHIDLGNGKIILGQENLTFGDSSKITAGKIGITMGSTTVNINKGNAYFGDSFTFEAGSKETPTADKNTNIKISAQNTNEDNTKEFPGSSITVQASGSIALQGTAVKYNGNTVDLPYIDNLKKNEIIEYKEVINEKIYPMESSDPDSIDIIHSSYYPNCVWQYNDRIFYSYMAEEKELIGKSWVNVSFTIDNINYLVSHRIRVLKGIAYLFYDKSHIYKLNGLNWVNIASTITGLTDYPISSSQFCVINDSIYRIYLDENNHYKTVIQEMVGNEFVTRNIWPELSISNPREYIITTGLGSSIITTSDGETYLLYYNEEYGVNASMHYNHGTWVNVSSVPWATDGKGHWQYNGADYFSITRENDHVHRKYNPDNKFFEDVYFRWFDEDDSEFTAGFYGRNVLVRNGKLYILDLRESDTDIWPGSRSYSGYRFGLDKEPIGTKQIYLTPEDKGIQYYQVDFYDDKFWHGDEELDYLALKAVMDDQTKFLWLSLDNLVYIPNITVDGPNGAFAFSTTFVRNDGSAAEPNYVPYISRIIINSENVVGFEEFAVARADELSALDARVTALENIPTAKI